jgi:hypothetical protein
MSKTLFMVAAIAHAPVADEVGYCLGVRFCYVDDVARMEDLLVKQIRKRYSDYTNMKPRQIRREVTFDVYEVPTPPRRGGHPKWLGPTAFYK